MLVRFLEIFHCPAAVLLTVVNYQLALIMSIITCCLYPLERKCHVFHSFCNHTMHPCV